MTEVILVRHGETLWNQQGRMQGQRDSPLTELGVRQARLLAGRLKDVSFAALYSSDLGRAYRTARSIADETAHEIVADTRLRERHFGIFEGLTNAEIEVRYPGHYERFASRDPEFAMPGGESALDFRERCLACMEEIAIRHAQTSVVVVAHGLVLDALYREALGMKLGQARGFPLLNCSVNTFRYESGRWKVVAVCDVAHLGAEGVTEFQSRVV
ncbi:MAG TPA: histidine phosphatase family protein [Burkholderiales bacterium]|jgi:Fructose-2,6-bisphosphatase